MNLDKTANANHSDNAIAILANGYEEAAFVEAQKDTGLHQDVTISQWVAWAKSIIIRRAEETKLHAASA